MGDLMFCEGERLFVYYNDDIYEGLCQDTHYSISENEPRFLIHYTGWSKRWDEWLTEDYLLKWTDVNYIYFRRRSEKRKKNKTCNDLTIKKRNPREDPNQMKLGKNKMNEPENKRRKIQINKKNNKQKQKKNNINNIEVNIKQMTKQDPKNNKQEKTLKDKKKKNNIKVNIKQMAKQDNIEEMKQEEKEKKTTQDMRETKKQDEKLEKEPEKEMSPLASQQGNEEKNKIKSDNNVIKKVKCLQTCLKTHHSFWRLPSGSSGLMNTKLPKKPLTPKRCLGFLKVPIIRRETLLQNAGNMTPGTTQPAFSVSSGYNHIRISSKEDVKLIFRKTPAFQGQCQQFLLTTKGPGGQKRDTTPTTDTTSATPVNRMT